MSDNNQDMTGGDYDHIDAPQYPDLQKFMIDDGVEVEAQAHGLDDPEYFGQFVQTEDENSIPEQSLRNDKTSGAAAGVATTSNKPYLTPKVLIILSGLGHLKMTPASGYDQDKDKEAKDDNISIVELEAKHEDESASAVPNTSVQGSIDTDSDTHGRGTGDSGATANAPKASGEDQRSPLFKSKYNFGTPETISTVDMKLKGKGLIHDHGRPSETGNSTAGISLAGSKKFTIPVPFRLTEIQPKKPVEIKETKFIFKARPAPKAKILHEPLDLPRPHTTLPTSYSESRIREQAKLKAANTFEARRQAQIEKKALETKRRKEELAKKMAESDARREAEFEKKKADIEARKLETEKKMIEAKERRKLAMEKKKKEGKKIEEAKQIDFKARPAPKYFKQSKTADGKPEPPIDKTKTEKIKYKEVNEINVIIP